MIGDKETLTWLADNTKREIGNEAVWTLSTAKQGNGVEQLRDLNRDTFWQ
jgi:anaphase-promoting complex subunit 10